MSQHTDAEIEARLRRVWVSRRNQILRSGSIIIENRWPILTLSSRQLRAST